MAPRVEWLRLLHSLVNSNRGMGAGREAEYLEPLSLLADLVVTREGYVRSAMGH